MEGEERSWRVFLILFYTLPAFANALHLYWRALRKCNYQLRRTFKNQPTDRQTDMRTHREVSTSKKTCIIDIHLFSSLQKFYWKIVDVEVSSSRNIYHALRPCCSQRICRNVVKESLSFADTISATLSLAWQIMMNSTEILSWNDAGF